MADVFSKTERSRIMSKVRSQGNETTEKRLIEIMRTNHITGWRRKQNVFGKPDFVFWRERVVVFVDGCFWHGCPHCYRRPKSSRKYWDNKLTRNKLRDKKVTKTLTNRGWKVVRFWEHQLKYERRVKWRLLYYLRRLERRRHDLDCLNT